VEDRKNMNSNNFSLIYIKDVRQVKTQKTNNKEESNNKTTVKKY